MTHKICIHLVLLCAMVFIHVVSGRNTMLKDALDYEYESRDAEDDHTRVEKSIPVDYYYNGGYTSDIPNIGSTTPSDSYTTDGQSTEQSVTNNPTIQNGSPTTSSSIVLDGQTTIANTEASISLKTLHVSEPETVSSNPGMYSERDVAKALYSNLLKDYDVRARPIQNQSKPIYVNTKFVPISIIEFDMSEQTFAVLGYFRVRWIDETMVWKPKYWNYINTVKVSTHALWKPNILLHKATDGQGEIGASETDILVVNWNGNVQWVPEGIYTVVCNVDIRNFPFDKQTCVFTYYVADESTSTVALDHYLTVDMSEYTENAAWILTSVSRKRVVRNSNYYVDIEFRLQRRANFALFTLIAPLMALAFLNISLFLVPVESGEKGSFSMTIFLSYGVFITIISDTLPNNSAQTSVFVVLIETLLCLSVLSVVYTVIQARVASSIGHKRCPIQCLITLKNRNQVAPIENGGMPPKVSPVYTWGMFLNQLDSVLFFVFLVAVTMIIGIFFAILLRHVNVADYHDDSEPPTTTRVFPIPTTASG